MKHFIGACDSPIRANQRRFTRGWRKRSVPLFLVILKGDTHNKQSQLCGAAYLRWKFSDENCSILTHSFKSGMTSDGAAHGTLCVCTCVSLSFSPCPCFLFLSFKRLCACVSSLSGLNEFHSFITVLSSHVPQAFWLGFVLNLYTAKMIFLFSIIVFSVQISKPFSNQDTFTWEAKWLNILSLVLKK